MVMTSEDYNDASVSLIPTERFSWTGCFWKLLCVTIPQVCSMVLMFSTGVMNVVMVGQLGDGAALGAMGLGTFTFNVCGASIVIGINGAIDTLVSQSFGAQTHEMSKLWLARAQWISTVVSTCVAVILWHAEAILLLLGQAPDVAALAARYVEVAVFGLWFTGQFDIVTRYCMCHHVPQIGSVVYFVGACLHAMWLYLLVPQHGIIGVGVVNVITPLTYLALATVYVTCFSDLPRGSPFRLDAFRGWLEYFRVALPSCGMLCLEWWAYEFCALFVGALHDTSQLAAHVSASNLQTLTYMVPLGVQLASASLVGHAMGAGDVVSAKRYASCAAVLLVGIVCVCFPSVTFGARSLAAFYAPGEQQGDVRYWMYQLFPFLAVQQVFDFAQCVMGGVYKGLGVPGYAAAGNLLAYYAVLLPVAYLSCLRWGHGVVGVWFAFTVGSLTVAAGSALGLSLLSWERLMLAAKARARAAKAA